MDTTNHAAVVRLNEAIQRAAFAAFKADAEAAPNDLIVALLNNLALVIATYDPSGAGHVLGFAQSALATTVHELRLLASAPPPARAVGR